MRKKTGRPLYRPVIRCVVAQTFEYLRLMRSVLGSNLTTVVLVSALGWTTGQDTTFPSAGETEDQAERTLAIRRPAPLDALAHRVGMAPDIVRRGLATLEAGGLVLNTPEGYLASAALLRGPEMERVRREAFVVIADFLAELSALGVQLPQPSLAAHETRRRVARLMMEFFLDASIPGLMRNLGWEPRKALVFMGVNHANYQTLRETPDLAQDIARSQSLVPDEARRPVSRYALARLTGLPHAATARLADELLAEGWFETVGCGGLIAPARVLVSDPIGAAALQSWEATVRYVQSLRRVGMPMPGASWSKLSEGVHLIPRVS